MKLTTSCTGNSLCLFKPIIHLLSYTLLLLFISTAAKAQQHTIQGTVIDNSTEEPLVNATVKLKNSDIVTQTDEEGKFILQMDGSEGVLEVSYLGYETKEIPVQGTDKMLTVRLRPEENLLEEVEVNTGYQTIPKERATGSFIQIDNDLLNRNLGSNIIERLNGVSSGILFDGSNVSQTNKAGITIRGRSTLFANDEPLIVLDNFPYDGDINSINPNDIENITILRDAAAASIWGVRAGNGVIVITSKTGHRNRKMSLLVNGNWTITDKPDLYYPKQMSSAEYIELEQFLFDHGRYNSTINYDYRALSPAVEIMLQHRKGTISDTQRKLKLDSLAQVDVRRDMSRFYYRRQMNQQYAANISGGSDIQEYYISIGYDRSAFNLVTDNEERFTVKANNTYRLFDDRFDLTTDLRYSKNGSKRGTQVYRPNNPYDRLVNDDGSPAILTDGQLRLGYIDTTGNGKLLDWHYRPLDENIANSSGSSVNLRLNLNGVFHILPWLDLSSSYQYQKGITSNEILYAADSYYVRNLVNTFSRFDPESNSIIQPLPEGAMYDVTRRNLTSRSFRALASIDRKINDNHHLVLLGGWEAKESVFSTGRSYLYGYDPETKVNANGTIDFSKPHPYWYNSSSQRIPNYDSNSETVDRFISYFFNGAYVFRDRYTLSASARKDQSNLFGVKPNDRGVPLWSAGLSWNAQREPFLRNIQWLSILKARGTFGYSGNVDRSLSAYLTAKPSIGPNPWNARNLNIVNPPNPSLKWERVKTLNFGVDYGLFQNSINGSIDFYVKDGLDLIGSSTIAPQTGITVFRGNTADTRVKGLDFILNLRNSINDVEWRTSVHASFVQNKVMNYNIQPQRNSSTASHNTDSPLKGYPYHAIFAFPWHGLDTLGNPLGMFEGHVTDNYSAILNSNDPELLTFIGSATPTAFGNILNSFAWKNFSFSFNITYKLGYFFRRSSAFSGGTIHYRQDQFSERWKQKGDERHTYIPSLIYPMNGSRTTFFDLSEVIVEKGDHARLRDVRLSYSVPSEWRYLSNTLMYVNVSNVAMLWKANKFGIDPDHIGGVPASTMFTIGVRARIK